MLILTLLACGPEAVSGPFALAYDGGEDCVEVDMGDLTPTETFTVDAWIRGEPEPADRARPVVSWPGAFTIGEVFGGDTAFSVGDATTGASSVVSVMDGVLHHLAGTWDGTTASLYVDGVRQAFVAGTAPAAPSSTLRIGCDGDVNAYEGLLDEVRISTRVRYEVGGFTPPSGPFDEDADTLALFHFDEGTGDETYDAAQGIIANVYGAEWIAFQLTVTE
ncbi:MAG: LamG domain-containing protein [Pseudomonadota bacterium]|nr:LamG domain-containing protein [Pseudomonadota bacterium]